MAKEAFAIAGRGAGLKGIKATIDPTKKIIGGDKAAPAVADEPVVMPEPDDEAVAAARRRKVAGIKKRGGRDSTILAGEENRLGG